MGMRDYELTASELEQVQWGMHQAPEAEVRQRATALHLSNYSCHRRNLSTSVSTDRSSCV